MKLRDVDYLRVRMISINELSISIALEDGCAYEFKYPTEEELSRDFESWTRSGSAQLSITDKTQPSNNAEGVFLEKTRPQSMAFYPRSTVGYSLIQSSNAFRASVSELNSNRFSGSCPLTTSQMTAASIEIMRTVSGSVRNRSEARLILH